MTRDRRYDILFEPVKIGPVTARNRFYQVPHCSGMGWQRPEMLAALRGMKAEGGWAVVCTEYCSIHPTSDDLPYPFARLWDDRDVKANALMTEEVHRHGALAGAELWHGGSRSANLHSREVSLDVTSLPAGSGDPFQSRAMDKADIRALRRWHRDAALRAKAAGFDIVYVYATHDYLLANFLSPTINRRGDEYGGSLVNRVRLLRELIEETKEAVGDSCALAVRFAADAAIDEDGAPVQGERTEMFALLAELPDLWDINIADYSYEMGVSRFVKEGALEPYMAHIKSLTTKPVVTVGRFTSPETMASLVKRGIVDFIGAARPSIADPFLPKKIEEGRPEEIRECIGCNICYGSNGRGVPIRCTQNPTIGEEWRRAWHAEQIAPKDGDATVLVVGAGPAGLECTRALGQRGYKVILAEARRALGGRVTLESQLPGLSEWARVRDYRLQRIAALPNVEIYPESRLTAEDVLAIAPQHTVVATGACWRRDGLGRSHPGGLEALAAGDAVFTPDDIMEGRLPAGPTLIFDDDGYYMAAVLAERLAAALPSVTLVTPYDRVASWASYTAEQRRSQKRLLELGVAIVTAHSLEGFDGEAAALGCVYTGKRRKLAATALVMVTARQAKDRLYRSLQALMAAGKGGSLRSLQRIGDCDAPATIAAAVYAGHRYARSFSSAVADDGCGASLP